MRFQRIVVQRFGGLRGLDTGEAPLPGLVVVTGPNEAGKSTFSSFLTSLLYGFYPASRDRHEYAPWDGEDARGSAVIRLDDGTCTEVRRRLLSTPRARLVQEDGTEEELRNRSLPWVTHVPRAVFGQVFALTLAELAALDQETWARVQDRLLGAMGSDDLRPAREVAEELEREAGALWRPTRRGNQRIRDLQDEIRELRRRRRDAARRDAELRAVTRNRDRARERLEEAREERARERMAVERAEERVPLGRRLARVAELEEEAGPDSLRDGLPEEPGVELERLAARTAELEERSRELEGEMEPARETVEALGEEEEALLEHRERIVSFTARATSWVGERARLRTLRQEVADLERRLASAGEEILAVPWDQAPTGPLLAASPAELRQAVRRLRGEREERRALELALERSPPSEESTASPWLVAGGALAAAGAALAAVAVAAGLPLVWAAAVPALLGGVLLLRRGLAGTAESGAPSAEEALERARAREDEARSRVAGLLRDIPVRPDLLADPDLALAAGVERLQELARDRADRREKVATIQAALDGADAEAAALAAALGRDGSLEAEELATLLEEELRRAERRADAARTARRELDRLERERARVDEKRDEAAARETALRHRLEELGGGDAGEGARIATTRLEAAARARQLREELRRRHPDLEQLRRELEAAEVGEDAWSLDPEELARRKARLETLDDEIETLAGEAERLDEALRGMLEKETVDAVDGEIATLEEEEHRLLAERDRRWILAHLVREADRRFREEHQPDLLRRAGAHLAELTDGRYRRMVADDGTGEHRFHLVGGAGGGLVPMAPPLSTGLLEQAYLALRLAIVDHLDQGREGLPLLVDEALVNWDPPRRERGLEVLARLARRRQIFFFTCHPPMAGRLEELGARRIELGPP